MLRKNLKPEEEDLVRQSIAGDSRAQLRLYRRYVRAMYNTVIRMVPDPLDAEDILQDAFVLVFRKLRDFRGESTLGAWIKRITINTTLNFLRRQGKLRIQPLDEDTPLAVPEPAASPRPDMARVHQAIKELPDGCRVVFTLFLLEGYQHQEIAGILNISESTSKSQYHRARRLLQASLENKITL